MAVTDRQTALWVVRVVVGLVWICAAACAAAMYSYTTIDSRVLMPLTVCMAVLFFTTRPLVRFWMWLTGSGSRPLAVALHVFVGATILIGSAMLVNFGGADIESMPVVKAEVIGKHSEKRQRSRRVGRRYHGSGTTYYVYFVSVRMPDGSEHEFNVGIPRFNSSRVGRTFRVRQGPGLLGVEVVRPA